MSDTDEATESNETPQKTRKRADALTRESYRLATRHKRLISQVQRMNRLENKSQALRYILDVLVGTSRSWKARS